MSGFKDPIKTTRTKENPYSSMLPATKAPRHLKVQQNTRPLPNVPPRDYGIHNRGKDALDAFENSFNNDLSSHSNQRSLISVKMASPSKSKIYLIFIFHF